VGGGRGRPRGPGDVDPVDRPRAAGAARAGVRSTQVGSWLGGTYNEQAREDPVHPAASQVRVAAFSDLARLDEVERQRALTRRALTFAADHPGYVGEVVLHNTLRMLNLEGAGWWRAQGDSVSMPRWAADAGAYGFLALALIALAGALTAGARRAPRWLWLVPIVLFATVIVAGSEIRYRAPVEPFIVLLAALAIHSLSQARRRSSRSRPTSGTASPTTASRTSPDSPIPSATMTMG
jgi:hypothetical protein